MIQERRHVDLHCDLLKQHELHFDLRISHHRESMVRPLQMATNMSAVQIEVGLETYVIVLRSVVATSVFARLSTFWNSETRALILECMYAFEHLMW